MHSLSLSPNPRDLLKLVIFFVAVAAAGCSGGGGGGGGGGSTITPLYPHQAGWPAPEMHGRAAKAAPEQGGGLGTCEQCHGADLKGGTSGVGCLSCHSGIIPAPHPARPWRGAPWTHTNTAPGNAQYCALCHLNSMNSSIPQDAPPAPGAAPSCFNNTLCHGPRAQHPAGWAAPASHGAGAKAHPDGSHGFRFCQDCHGSDFAGGGVQVACASCHGVNAPHPRKPWVGTLTHISTDPDNASVCMQCHANGANSSLKPSSPPASGAPAGCFNNTLCHGVRGQHPSGWSAPAVHGASAKAAPGGAAGFSYCGTCHGAGFAGGQVQVACSSCHGVNAPHPKKPWVGTLTHITTDPGNAPVCAACHTNGANSSLKPATAPPAGTSPGCFNNTLCHGVRGQHPAGWSAFTVHGASAKATPGGSSGFPYCQTCHGTDFGGGQVQVTCLSAASCHRAPAPHSPRPWRGGAATHTNTDPGNAAACGLCHRAPATIPGGAFNCFNNTLCHGPRPAHPAGWANPDSHGPGAKTAAGPTSGFAYCGQCHGADFAGGAVQTSCLSTAGCHGVAAPHSPKPWHGTRTHTGTDQSNAPVCFLCHANGGNSSLKPASPPPAGTPPGCFNNTLCHGPMQHPAGWATAHAISARAGVAGCGTASCHGADFRGGSAGVSCYACHLGGPNPGAGIMHPSRWTDPRNVHDGYLEAIGKNASSCAPPPSPKGANIAQYCHGTGLAQTAVRVAPPNGSWTQAPSCYTCHGKEWIVP